MGILARWGGLSPFLSSALPRCTHGPVQLFIFSYWGCSIHWLAHLLCSIGVRQHLFEERNVAFHWQSSKNAGDIMKTFKRQRYSWVRWRTPSKQNNSHDEWQDLSAATSTSTHHLDTGERRGAWITLSAGKWSRDPIRRSFILKVPAEQWLQACEMWPFLQRQDRRVGASCFEEVAVTMGRLGESSQRSQCNYPKSVKSKMARWSTLCWNRRWSHLDFRELRPWPVCCLSLHDTYVCSPQFF